MKLDLLLDSASAKIMGAVLVAAPIAATTPINQLSTPIIGASLTTLVSALIGSACAFGLKGEANRVKLFTLVFVFAVVACALVTVVPWYYDRTIPEPVQGPLALLFAFAARFMGPVFAEYAPAMTRRFMDAWRAPQPPSKGE